MKVRIFSAHHRALCETMLDHVDKMQDFACELLAQLRAMIRRYRLSNTTREICEIRDIYLKAEDQIRLDHIKRLLRIYREAQRDCVAMHRVGTR